MDVESGLTDAELPSGIDRRSFMMRSAMIGAVAVLAGHAPANAKKAATAPQVNLSRDLDVVKKSKGPVMMTLEEFQRSFRQ